MAHSENWLRVMDASRSASQIRSLALAAGALATGSAPEDKAQVDCAIVDLLEVIELLAGQTGKVMDELEVRVG